MLAMRVLCMGVCRDTIGIRINHRELSRQEHGT